MVEQQRVTREDVARLAGTSAAVVSYVVNNGPRPVAAATRARVLAAIETTGYSPNVIAKSLASGSSGTLGLVLPDISNPFFAALGRAIEDEVFASGRVLLLGNSAESDQREVELVRSFIQHRVDGLLYVGVGHHSHIEEALRANIPVVLLDRDDPDTNASSVVVDNYEGAVMATEHLIGHGHRRIAIIAGPSAIFTAVERIGGWRKALKSKGLSNGNDLFFEAPFTRQGGYDVADQVFAAPMPDAILAANELQALGLISRAAELGIRIPEDVALISFDGTDESRFSIPPLTTVAQPLKAIARNAVALARPRNADGPTRIRCDVELIRRRSCGCIYPTNENRQVPSQTPISGDTWQSPPKEESSMNRNLGRVLGATAAVAALSLTAGCASSASSDPHTSSSAEHVTITFVNPQQGVFDNAIASFEKLHPNITVQQQIIPFATIDAQEQTRLSSKDSSIDVMSVDPPVLPSLAAQGVLADVSSDKAAMQDKLTAGGVKSVTWNNKQWAYPLWTSDNFLFYNKALLEKAGITPPGAGNSDRWTWDQTVAAAKKAQAAGAQYGFAFEQVNAYYALQPVLMSMGAKSGLSGSGNLTPAIDTPQWVDFGNWYGSLYSSGLAPKGIASAQLPDLFQDGKIAFYVAGPARITTLQASPLANGWGMAPQPYAAGGKVVTPTDSWSVGVSAYSKHQEAAREFASYLSLNTNASVAASKGFNLPPVNQKAYPKYIHYIQGIAQAETKQYGNLLTVDSDEHAVRRPESVGYTDFLTIVQQAFTNISDGGDAAANLKAAQAQLVHQLAQDK